MRCHGRAFKERSKAVCERIAKKNIDWKENVRTILEDIDCSAEFNLSHLFQFFNSLIKSPKNSYYIMNLNPINGKRLKSIENSPKKLCKDRKAFASF